MNWQQIVTRSISEISALCRKCSESRKGLRILLYHTVGTSIKEDIRNLFSISPELFEAHMAELSQYKNTSIIGLTDTLNTKQKHGVAITFDDGYRDNLTIAAPILERYQIPFTVFISTAYIRSRTHPYLSEAEVRMLSEKPNVTIGSHGVSHAPLTECSQEKLRDELESSKHYLEDLTGKEIVSISYPHGRVNRRVLDAAANAGYKIGASSIFNINNSSQNCLMLCRTCILGSDSVRIFRQKLHGDWDWYRWQQYLSMQQ